MRLHVLSDLHLEFAPFELPEVAADVTVLAGDVHTGANGLKWILERIETRPVVYVLGNHEFYGQVMQKLVRELRAAAKGTNVHILENDFVQVDDVTFIGATLWTDLALFGDPLLSGTTLQTSMADFRRIRTEPRYSRLRPIETRTLHLDSRAYIEQQCSLRKSQKIAVITHHAPSALSVPKLFESDPVTAGYASRMDATVEASHAALWVHGHMHHAVDYRIGGTRVIANPRGYPDEQGTGFNPSLVVEV